MQVAERQPAEAHSGRMETQFQHWGEKLDALIALVEAASSTLKTDYQKRIDDVRSKYQTAHTRFADFKMAGSATWGGFKSVLGRAIAKLGDTL